jgi:hypothetical protein
VNVSTAHPARLVLANLWPIHRPIMIWFWSIVVVGVLVVGFVVAVDTGGEGLWSYVAGSAAKFCLLVIGIMLVGNHLRMFVANGITRRHFLLGAGAFGVLSAVGYTAIVLLGSVAERQLFGPGQPSIASLPVADAAGGLLPIFSSYLLVGALVGASYYRYGPRVGTLLLIPAFVAIFGAEFLVGLEQQDAAADRMPYALAVPLLILIAVAVAGAAWFVLRDVAIRRPSR